MGVDRHLNTFEVAMALRKGLKRMYADKYEFVKHLDGPEDESKIFIRVLGRPFVIHVYNDDENKS